MANVTDNYARQAAAAASMRWPSITVASMADLADYDIHRIHDSITLTPKGPHMKPRVTDAQVRVNHETQWLAADVVFVTAAQLDAGPPYTGQRYTYKAPLGTVHKQGLLAHVIGPRGLQPVLIDAIRTPTTEDKLTAHAWLIVDGDYKTYQNLVKADTDAVAVINKAQADAKLEAELRESLTRTGAAVKSESPPETKGVQVRVGGVYRSASGSVQHIRFAGETGSSEFCFTAESGNCYNAQGERLGRDPKETLIAEIA